MLKSSSFVTMPRQQFMQAAKDELVAFEQRELELRRKWQDERAAELRLPISKDR